MRSGVACDDRAMSDERLAWIYTATTPDELRDRYDVWAADYDVDLDALGWQAPAAGAARCAAFLSAGGEVLDAGCGTGLVGAALAAGGVSNVVGFDLSPEMLRRAGATGAYRELHHGSLLEPLPFAPGRFAAVVSVGVFTYGHVGPEAFSGLIDVVKPGGHVTLTFRADAIDALGYAAAAQRLERKGRWQVVEPGVPESLLVEDGADVRLIVRTWAIPIS